MNNSNRDYGQGAAAYGRYLGASYGGFVIGDYMTEGVFPVLLHQDPRYFRKACCGWKRLGYSLGQVFWTHTDSGGTQFNYSEVLGNAVAVAISTSYYKETRSASEAGSQLGLQIGVDMASNLLKEYWPESSTNYQESVRRGAGALQTPPCESSTTGCGQRAANTRPGTTTCNEALHHTLAKRLLIFWHAAKRRGRNSFTCVW